ncbi:hypothetical protein HMSSN139_28460 [Paenibacillus sp. HMSSN-139]|nr:hypothetical protein HMSSN139_28460 [Paenibacillus sp. HMSSN-139]
MTFLAFDELDILDVYNTEKKHLPNKHVPFAIDNEGNMFCFDFDNVSSSPSIVFVEKGGEASANFVAKNFKDFIYLLK